MRRTPALLIAICGVFLPATGAGAANAPFCPALKAELVRGGGGASGLLVVDLDSGRVVCRRAAARARPLASNMKLFTTGAALASLGPQYRIATRVLSNGRLGDDGVLHGNLFLKGGGDPTLGSPAFNKRFHDGLGTDLFALRPQIRAAGIASVTGRLYADDTVFDRLRGVADSGYATSPWIGPLSGLAFDSGYGDLRARRFASDPAKLAAATLTRSLRRAGVHIRTRVALRKAPAAARQVAVVRSPTLTRIVNATDVYSDNFFAETLNKLLGARFGTEGSTRAGAAVVTHFARSHGSGVHAVDGSGLTRSGRASPNQVVALLKSMRYSAVGDDFIQDLALAGREGTVASRMHGTRAAGRCRTKTGTLTGVSNLSGYCFNRSGKTMAFSILMGSVRDISLAHQEQDRIAAAVASY